MEKIKLKDWVNTLIESNMVKVMGSGVLPKLLELSALQDWFNAMYGIDLEVYVKPAEVEENKFYSKGAVEQLRPASPHSNE